MSNQDTTQRNMAICDDHDNGMSYRAIAEKYGISPVRACQIYKRRQQRARFKQDNELYSVIADAAIMLKKSESQSIKLYNILMRNGVDDIDKLSSLCLKELFSWRNAGRDCVALCAVAQEMIVERKLIKKEDI